MLKIHGKKYWWFTNYISLVFRNSATQVAHPLYLISFAFEDFWLFLKIKCTFKIQKLIITDDIEKILKAITKKECFKKFFKQK